MKYSFLTVVSLILVSITAAWAQTFEGSIEFKKILPNDTSIYVYHVKGNNVRIDEMGADGKTLEGSMLLNLADKKIYALSHDRKLYMERPYKNEQTSKMNLEVERSANSKFINGFECSQWRVKNKDKDSEITSWVAQGNFDFFLPLLQLLNRKDNFATFYLQVPDTKGFFPMLAVERTLLRDEKGRLQVTKVSKKSPDAAFMEIPKGYVKMDK